LEEIEPKSDFCGWRRPQLFPSDRFRRSFTLREARAAAPARRLAISSPPNRRNNPSSRAGAARYALSSARSSELAAAIART